MGTLEERFGKGDDVGEEIGDLALTTAERKRKKKT